MKLLIFGLITAMLFTATLSLAQVKKIVSEKQGSSITYQLTHPLHEIEAVSNEAYCDVYADPAARQIKHVFVKVPVNTFNSGNSSRDSHAMEVIEAISFPESKFTSSLVSQIGDSLIVTGKMTFHGITNELTFTALCRWSDEKLVVTGGFDLSLTAFKVERPALLLIPVKDNLKFTFTEVFKLR